MRLPLLIQCSFCGPCNVIKIYDYRLNIHCVILYAAKNKISIYALSSALYRCTWKLQISYEIPTRYADADGKARKNLHNAINYTLYLGSDNYDNSLVVVVCRHRCRSEKGEKEKRLHCRKWECVLGWAGSWGAKKMRRREKLDNEFKNEGKLKKDKNFILCRWKNCAWKHFYVF